MQRQKNLTEKTKTVAAVFSSKACFERFNPMSMKVYSLEN